MAYPVTNATPQVDVHATAHNHVVDVKLHFGAVGDGVTDDTDAFSDAIDYINTVNPGVVESEQVLGSTLYIPDGIYRIAGAVSAITKSGCTIRGSSTMGAVLRLEYDGATFQFGDATSDLIVGGSFENLKVEYVSAPGSSAIVLQMQYASRITVTDLHLVNIGTLAYMGPTSGRWASAILFDRIIGYVHNGGRPSFQCDYGAGLYVSNTHMFVGGVVTPTTDRTSTMTTLAGTNAFVFGTGTWDAVQIENSFFERYYRGIEAICSTGAVILNGFVSNTIFDYIRSDCVWFATSNGGIYSWHFSNCWFAAWEGTGVYLSGSVRGHEFNGNRFVSAGEHSVSINASAEDIIIADSIMAGSNRLNVNAHGIVVFGGSHIKLVNNNVGRDSTWGGFAWQPLFGIAIAADLDYIEVRGNEAAGTSLAYYIEANASGSANRNISDNIAANYAGDRTGAGIFTAPASTVTWTNTSAHFLEVYIGGGTVTAIAKNGVTTGMIDGTILLAPGDTYAVTYSLAPTISYMAKP